MPAAIRSTRIVTPQGVRPGIIHFEHGTIRSVLPIESEVHGLEISNAGDAVVLPGLIDVHVHINEPGRTEWEGFQTGTRAAAAGGFSAIVDMPLNSIPSTTNPESLSLKREAAARQCRVDYAFWGGVVGSNSKEIPELARAGVRGFKCFLVHPGTEEFQMVTEADLHQAMPLIAESGLPLLVHAEHPAALEAAQARLGEEDWRNYHTYLASRPDESEVEAIRLMIRLCRQHSCRVHIVHLSSAKALPDIQEARAEGLPLTVETCPHYLTFAAEEVSEGATQFKCAPPIRSAANREKLWQALADGVIDLIATDHSPCPPALKSFETGDFRTAWGGISGLSLGFSVVWTEAWKRGFSLLDIARWMAERPAELAGVSERKGQIAEGYDADFVIVQPTEEYTVRSDQLYFRHACSPYVGQTLRGVVQATFVRGEITYECRHFPGQPPGREMLVQ